MDGHTTGSPQGAGGQNPAYRPAHRHPPVRTLESWAFVTDSRLVARCRAGLLSAGQRRGKRTPGALGVESPTPKGVRDEGTPASTRNRGTEYGRAQGEPSYVLLPRTSFDVHRLGWSVFGQTSSSYVGVRGKARGGGFGRTVVGARVSLRGTHRPSAVGCCWLVQPHRFGRRGWLALALVA